MQIYGPTQLHGAQPISAPHTARLNQTSATAASGAPIQDELNLSDAAQLIQKVHELPDIRQDRVNQIRAQIAAGTYETDEKLSLALGRLMDEIA
jgi:negative regulator of flagellin synthesis FlgM